MPDMMSMINNILAPMASQSGADIYPIYRVICLVLLLVMMVAAIVSVIIVLVQPGNSTGIDALGGSSETFFGKNKGQSIEYKMKKWTIISLIVLTTLSIIFFILQLPGLWGLSA